MHISDSKVHGANMEPIWGRQDPGGPHVGPMNFSIWVKANCLESSVGITIPVPPHSWVVTEPHLSWKLVWINSLAPGKFEWNFRYIIFKWILVIDGWSISCEIALIWMLLDFTDDQSTLVQVMAWCHQTTSHYLSQCWPRSLSPYGVTRPQWVCSQLVVLVMTTRVTYLIISMSYWCPAKQTMHV